MMLGVITKDLYQNLAINKVRWGLIGNYGVALMSVFLIQNIYGLLFSAIIYIPFVIVPTLLQVSSERDEVSHFDRTQLTMPVTKTDVISAKYILGFLFILFNMLILALCSMYHLFAIGSIDYRELLYILIASFILSIVSIAFNYVSFIFFGSKGILVYGGLIATLFLFYFWEPASTKLEQFLEIFSNMSIPSIFGLGFVIAAVLFLISFLISKTYYSKKSIV